MMNKENSPLKQMVNCVCKQGAITNTKSRVILYSSSERRQRIPPFLRDHLEKHASYIEKSKPNIDK